MATKTADLHIRISPDLKEQAENYFEKNGVTMSQALEQFLAWTVKHQKTPMRLKRRIDIPDLSSMTKEEVSAMLAESERDIAEGRVFTLEQVEKMVQEKYGIQI